MAITVGEVNAVLSARDDMSAAMKNAQTAMTDLVVRVAEGSEEMRTNLAQGVTQFETTSAALAKMSNAFDGSQIITQAGAVVGAILNVGDITKLTRGEQEQVNRVLEQALDKYRALGIQAPAGMQAIADATRKVEDATTAWESFVDKFNVKDAISHPMAAAKDAMAAFAETLGPTAIALTGLAASGVAVGAALFELTEHAAQAGGHLHDVSETLGIAVPQVSRLSNAATVAGTDISTLGNAMFMLQKNMELSPDKFEQGLKRIGINFGEFKAMSPDQELIAISTALKATEDPVQRNAAGFELMGRQFRDLEPALLKMNDALAMTADIQPWTKEQAEAAEAFEMQLTSIKVHAEALGLSLGRELLAPMSEFLGLLKAIKPAFDSWTGGFGGVLTPIHALTEAFGYASAAVEVFRGTAQETVPAVEALAKQQEALNAAFDAAHSPDADVKAWKDSVEALVPHMVTLDEALAAQKEVQQDLDPSTKTAIASGLKWAQVMGELNSVGDGWRGTLKEMNGAVVEAIRYYLSAGVSQSALAEAYGLTGAQVKAVASELRNESEALKLNAAATEQVTKLWDEFQQVASSGGSVFDNQIAAIDRWAQDLEAKAQKAGTDTKEFYDALSSVWSAKLTEANHNFALQDEYSRASFQKRADDATEAYNHMLADSSNYTNAEIRQAGERMRERTRELNSWTSGVTDAIEQIEDSAKSMPDAFKGGIDAMNQMKQTADEAAAAMSKAMGYSVDVNYQNFKGMLEGAMDASTADVQGIHHHEGNTSNLSYADEQGNLHQITVMEAASKGYSFQEIVAGLKGSPLGPHPGGPRIPGFKEGGPTGSGGVAMLHADEYVVPKDGALVLTGKSSGSDDRARWDQLNEQQAAMWLAAGRTVTAEQQKLIDLMEPLTPEGYGRIASNMKPVTIQINVQGSVYTMDPAGKAAFAQHISDALLPLFRQGRQWPSA